MDGPVGFAELDNLGFGRGDSYRDEGERVEDQSTHRAILAKPRSRAKLPFRKIRERSQDL